jgi:hypothetical protein
MRIAIGILSLALGILVLMQSCAVTVGSDMIGDDATSGAGSLGIIVGLLYFVGGSFAFGLPIVSLIIFLLAAVIGFSAGSGGVFKDLEVWAYVAIVLALLSFFAVQSARKNDQTKLPQ